MLALALAAVLAASPASLQARYDAARHVVEFSRDARAVAAARTEIGWLERHDLRPRGVRYRMPAVPPTWLRAHPPGLRDRRLSARLAVVGNRFHGWAAFWVHDLRTGRTASWNSDARFPAASTVKLGVLAAALRAYRPRPGRSHVAYDLRQLTAWSSNLAANRLSGLLGPGRVQTGLRALGMSSSTYTGPYRIGTARALDAPKPPPQVSSRVTTAHDLGRALYSFHAFARRPGFLTRHEARYGLRLLRGSLPAANNEGLLRPWLRRTAVAEKNGWTPDARLTAAVVYRARGPLIVVVAAYRPNLPFTEARVLGRDVLRVLGLA